MIAHLHEWVKNTKDVSAPLELYNLSHHKHKQLFINQVAHFYVINYDGHNFDTYQFWWNIVHCWEITLWHYT